MKYSKTFIDLIPKSVMKQVKDKLVIVAGYVTEDNRTEPVNTMYTTPVSIDVAIEGLEQKRDVIEGCHLLLEDQSVLWFDTGAFIDYDSYKVLQIKSGFFTEDGSGGEKSKFEMQDVIVKTFSKNDIQDLLEGRYCSIRDLSVIKNKIPKGWMRTSLYNEFMENDRGIFMGDNYGYGAYFIDTTGYGKDTEPALTIQEFIGKIRPEIGYGIVEEGKYQSKVGVFTRNKQGGAV